MAIDRDDPVYGRDGRANRTSGTETTSWSMVAAVLAVLVLIFGLMMIGNRDMSSVTMPNEHAPVTSTAPTPAAPAIPAPAPSKD